MSTWLGQSLRCAQRGDNRSAAPRAANRVVSVGHRDAGTPSTPVSGRAATRKPARRAATTIMRIAIPATPMASRSWRAGTTPGSSSSHRCSSWTAPLRVRRMMPGENLNPVAAEQIRSWLGQGARLPRPQRRPARRPDLHLRRWLRSAATQSGPRWSGARSLLFACSSCACAPVAASTPTPPPSRTPDGHVDTERSSSATIRRPGRRRRMTGQPTIRATVTSACRRGAACIPRQHPQRGTSHAARANRARWSAGR